MFTLLSNESACLALVRVVLEEFDKAFGIGLGIYATDFASIQIQALQQGLAVLVCVVFRYFLAS